MNCIFSLHQTSLLSVTKTDWRFSGLRLFENKCITPKYLFSFLTIRVGNKGILIFSFCIWSRYVSAHVSYIRWSIFVVVSSLILRGETVKILLNSFVHQFIHLLNKDVTYTFKYIRKCLKIVKSIWKKNLRFQSEPSHG